MATKKKVTHKNPVTTKQPKPAKTNVKKATNPNLRFLAKAHRLVRQHLSATMELPEFLQTAGGLTLNQRRTIVDQALLLFTENYVHLPLKESMHGIDPVQRLKLIQHRLSQQTPATADTEYTFHREMLEVFNSVRDLHTNYLLPAPYNKVSAFMPFNIESYFEKKLERYVASHFMQGFSHSHFRPGVEILTWNSVPIGRAVEVSANYHAGSNLPARRARGVDGLTFRSLMSHFPPDEMWVDIGYLDLNGKTREMRQEWLVSEPLPDTDSANLGKLSIAAASQGIEIDADIMRRMWQMLFAPSATVLKSTISKAAHADGTIPSSMPKVFRARVQSTPNGDFGYLRIFTFAVKKPESFIKECTRLIKQMPGRGLIIDVRGNSGGHIHPNEYST
ncbi:MAG: hypothetical protein ACI9HY_000039 [Planctomycetaceae bacterium]|jgi:hypothetical protein